MDAKIYTQGPLVNHPLRARGKGRGGAGGRGGKSEREGGMKGRKKGMKEERKERGKANRFPTFTSRLIKM